MICTYEYRDDILFITFPKKISSSDLAAYSDELERMEKQYPVIPDRIVDLRRAESFDGKFDTVLDFSKKRIEKNQPNAYQVALLVENNYQMGFARMYQTMSDNPQSTIHIFTNETQAFEWIKTKK